jgi:hypothetical protein
VARVAQNFVVVEGYGLDFGKSRHMLGNYNLGFLRELRAFFAFFAIFAVKVFWFRLHPKVKIS